MVLLCLCCELDAKKVAASFDRSALKYKLLPERNTKYETIPFPNSILISMNEWENIYAVGLDWMEISEWGEVKSTLRCS